MATVLEERRKRDTGLQVSDISMELIKDNPYQTRKRYSRSGIKLLARSILDRGLMNPISVVKIGENYVIVGGHRRHRAFKYLKRKTIPAIIRKQSTQNDLKLDLVIENVLRRDFAPVEKGQAIFQVLCTIPSVNHDLIRAFTLVNQIRLVEKRKVVGDKFVKGYRFNVDDVPRAERPLEMMAIGANTAIKYLRLLDLPKIIQENVIVAYSDTNSDSWLRKGQITVSMAYELSRIADNEVRIQLFKRIIKERIRYIHLKFIVDEILENGGEQHTHLGKGSAKKKRDEDRTSILSQRCFRLGSSLMNHRQRLTLDQLSIDEIIFRASLKKLRRSCMELTSKVNDLLDETNVNAIERLNQDFSLVLRKGSHGALLRYSIKNAKVRELELKPGDKLVMKIIGIERKRTN